MLSRTVRKLLVSRSTPLLALCLPVVWSLVACLCEAKPQAMSDVPSIPSLAFEQYYVNLREVAASEEVYAYFSFCNVGDVTLTIDQLQPSCGCLLPQMKKKVYQPGEEGEFLLRIRTTAQQPGPKEFTVKVHYTDTQPRFREVFLRVVFPQEQLYARPMSLAVHQLGSSPVEQEIVVTDLRKSPAGILGVSTTSDLVQAAVLSPTTSPTGAKLQRIKVTVPGPIPSGRQLVMVKIYTDDEKIHEIKVPMQVYGPDKNSGTQRLAKPPLMGPVYR
ncbi:MAG: hypothetical protein JWM11_5291 [Planctomycetaceae bacterium]|nr:hypothetical protein [Planctomycetaceae bacterium]